MREITLFKEEKAYYKLMTLAVLAAAVFFVCRIVYAGILALPYPKELLEASNVALTNTFIEGKSPYSVASLARDIPGVNYDYPFFNSLLAAGLAYVTGCGAVKAHFTISLLSIIISGVIGFKMMNKCAKTTVSLVFTAMMFMFCHWRFGYISAAPDDLGLLLLLLTSYVAISDRVRNKPLFCAIGITLCLYTKQYFVFIAPGLFIYMFLYSRKEAIKLLAWSLGINTVVCILITLFWPLYWIKAFLLTYLGTIVGGGDEFVTFLAQIKYLLVLFIALFTVIVVSSALSLRKYYRNRKNGREMKETAGIRVGENDPFAMALIQSIVMIIPLFLIGRNDGAFISYFLQLWIPFISVVAIVCFEKLKPEKHEFIFTGVYAAILAVTIYFGFGKLPLHILTQDEIGKWHKVLEYTESARKTGDVYYSRILAYDQYENKHGECFCGHDSEIAAVTVSILEAEGLNTDSFSQIFPLIEQNLAYRDMAIQKGQEHEYSLIVLDSSEAFSLFTVDQCESLGYKLRDRITVQVGNMPYDLLFYVL